jgi:hypothetical protein
MHWKTFQRSLHSGEAFSVNPGPKTGLLITVNSNQEIGFSNCVSIRGRDTRA